MGGGKATLLWICMDAPSLLKRCCCLCVCLSVCMCTCVCTYVRELVEQGGQGGHDAVDQAVLEGQDEGAGEGEEHHQARGARDAEGLDELCWWPVGVVVVGQGEDWIVGLCW